MNWHKCIDLKTFNDGWLTWKNHFKDKFKPDINFSKFYELSLKGEYVTLSVSEYVNLQPLNSGLHRLKFNSAEEAYSDKPRGDDDIDSVNYHINTKNSVSPIILIVINDEYINLDGVHRIVAAKLRNSDIRMLVLKPNIRFKYIK